MLGSVSVVVPVYCNADTLAELHTRLSAVLHGCATSHEIIFVNDACPAGSGAVLNRLAASDSCVRVHSHAQNRGQQRAVLTGLGMASGLVIVVLDADLQDTPEAIPSLVEAVGQMGNGAVFAGRRGHYEPNGRLLTSRVFKRMIAWTCGVPKDGGSFVAMSRAVAVRLLQMKTRRPYLLAMIGLTGYPTRSLPVERIERPRGTSAYTERMRWRMGFDALTTIVLVKYLCR
jgi:glycosyltransferase involved in cell wall biosynthesis